MALPLNTAVSKGLEAPSRPRERLEMALRRPSLSMFRRAAESWTTSSPVAESQSSDDASPSRKALLKPFEGPLVS